MPKETKILETLLINIDKCISREDISEVIWPGVKVSARTLDSHISRLRQKLRSSLECSIDTIYGEGYRLRIGSQTLD